MMIVGAGIRVLIRSLFSFLSGQKLMQKENGTDLEYILR